MGADKEAAVGPETLHVIIRSELGTVFVASFRFKCLMGGLFLYILY